MQVRILPSRQALVDRIELQYEYGQSIICLNGPAGLGKSYILETFVTDKYPEFNKVYIQLFPKFTEKQFISQLLEQCFNTPLIDYTLSLSENYDNLCMQQGASDLVLVIDNANYLSLEIEKEIESIIAQTKCQFYVLTASSNKPKFSHCTHLHFEPLSAHESLQLMQMYFTTLPDIDEPVFKSFIASAKGNPALLLGYKKETVKVSKNKLQYSMLMILSVLFIVVLTFVLALIFRKEITDEIFTQQVVESDPAIVNTVIQSKDIIQNKQSVPVDEIKEIETQSKEKPKVSIENISAAYNDINKKVLSSDLDGVDAKVSKSEIVEKVKLVQESAKSDTDNSQPIKQAENAVHVEKRDIAKVNTEYDNSWFLAQDDSHLVIQLMGVSTKTLLNNFINNHQQHELKVYQSRRQGQLWWVIAVGPYNSIKQAQNAKQALSEELRALQPFTKSIAKIKQEINPSN